jgi:hypothetical protein
MWQEEPAPNRTGSAGTTITGAVPILSHPLTRK